MRRALARAVRRAFHQHLRKELPQFDEMRVPSLPDGYRLYVWKASDQLGFFVELEVAQKWDRFNITIGWNESNSWPVTAPTVKPSDPAIRGQMRFRLDCLWPRAESVFLGWEVVPTWKAGEDLDELLNPPPVESVLPRVEPLVQDAVGKIRDYALPYFLSVAEEKTTGGQADKGI